LKKALILIIFLLFFTTSVFAYSDFAVVDIELPPSIVSGQSLDVNITLVNNSLSEVNIPLTITVYAPSAEKVFEDNFPVAVFPESSSKNLYSLDISDLNGSTQPYLLRAVITEPTGNQNNNMLSSYFTIRKGASKIPVPDLPYFLPIILIVFVAFFILNKKEQKRKLKKNVKK